VFESASTSVVLLGVHIARGGLSRPGPGSRRVAAVPSDRPGAEISRWIGIIAAALAAISAIFVMPYYPVWPLIYIAIAIMVIYGLAARYGEQPRDGRLPAAPAGQDLTPVISAAARRPGYGRRRWARSADGEVQVLAGDLAEGLLVTGVALVVPSIGWSQMQRRMANPAKPLTAAATAGQWV
jgi:hypothetical protein